MMMLFYKTTFNSHAILQTLTGFPGSTLRAARYLVLRLPAGREESVEIASWRIDRFYRAEMRALFPVATRHSVRICEIANKAGSR